MPIIHQRNVTERFYSMMRSRTESRHRYDGNGTRRAKEDSSNGCLATKRRSKRIHCQVPSGIPSTGGRHPRDHRAFRPQSNGMAERLNRTIADKFACTLIEAHLSSKVWLFAVEYAVYVYSNLPHSPQTKSTETNLASLRGTPLAA